nr:nucleic acid-binding, OB-fold protein [Tanacetum cinerariifolium]
MLKKWYYQRCRTIGTQVIPRDPIPTCKNHGPQSTLVYSSCFKSIIGDETTTISLTCFIVQANSLTMDCNELIAELLDKDLYHLSSTLKELQGTAHTFQFHFDAFSDRLSPGATHGERLVVVLYRKVSADIRKEDWGDGDVTLGLLEHLRLDNVEKAVCLLLMMKETEVKIAEKNLSIRRLRRNGAVVGVGFCFKMPNVPNRLVVKDRLLTVFNEEVGGDVTIIREYRGVAQTVRFMKGLQADEMDRCNRTLSLMREVEVKAREKSRGISNDVRLGTEIIALCARLTVIVDERVNFFNELDMLALEFVPVKMVELMKQIQDKDIRNLMKLQRLGREFELRGQEKDIFIRKLKGTIDF